MSQLKNQSLEQLFVLMEQFSFWKLTRIENKQGEPGVRVEIRVERPDREYRKIITASAKTPHDAIRKALNKAAEFRTHGKFELRLAT